MRRTEAMALVVVALLSGLFFLPLIDGVVRTAFGLERPGTLVVSWPPPGAGKPCVGLHHGEICVPLWAYPVWLPYWYRATLFGR